MPAPHTRPKSRLPHLQECLFALPLVSAVLLVLTVFLGGCANYQNIEETPVSVLEKYEEEIDPVKQVDEETGENRFDYSRKLSFAQCIGVMLENSDQLKLAATDITLQRIAQDDAFYKMFPNVTVRTYMTWNLSEPTNLEKSEEELDDDDEKRNPRFRMNFRITSSDIFGQYAKTKAYGVAILAAKISHHKVVAESIYNLAVMYMEVEYLEKQLAMLAGMEKLAKQATAYTSTLNKGGFAPTLETLISLQREKSIEAEREELEATIALIKESGKGLLGVPSEHNLKLDTDGSASLASQYNPKQFSLEDVLAFDFQNQLLEQKMNAGEYRVLGAWAKYYPKLDWNIRMPDPVDSSSSDQSYYFTLGFSMKVLDWGERWRGVERQKLLQRQVRLQHSQLRKQLTYEVKKIQAELRTTRAKVDIAKNEVKLKEMELRKAEILFNSGTQPLSYYLNAQNTHLKAKMNLMDKRHEYNKRLLSMRNLSGDLSNAYVYRSFDYDEDY